MLKIKLARIGKKKQPAYRIVVMPARSKISGRYLTQIGFYNPLTQPATIKLDKNKYQGWLKKGAQPTASLKLLLKNERTPCLPY